MEEQYDKLPATLTDEELIRFFETQVAEGHRHFRGYHYHRLCALAGYKHDASMQSSTSYFYSTRLIEMLVFNAKLSLLNNWDFLQTLRQNLGKSLTAYTAIRLGGLCGRKPLIPVTDYGTYKIEDVEWIDCAIEAYKRIFNIQPIDNID
jgi:hypothetical protein